MKTLKLHLDDLAVESFPTLPQDEPRGTVHAANAPTVYEWEYSCANSCPDSQCWPVAPETAGWTCPESFADTCWNTCVTCGACYTNFTSYTCQTCTCPEATC